MSPHVPQLGHILGEQQSLLHCVDHVAGCSSLEVPNGGIGQQRGPIQHQGRKLGWRPDLRIIPLLNTLLPYLGLLSRSLSLVLLGREGFSNSHHLLAFGSLFIFRSIGWKGRVGRGWEAYSELPSQARPSPVGTLSSLTGRTLVYAESSSRQVSIRMMAEIRSRSFQGYSLVEDFKLVLGIRYFNYIFLFCVGGARRSGYPNYLLQW